MKSQVQKVGSYTPVEERARQSLGSSSKAIYRMVREALLEHNVSKGVLVDVGCGKGSLWGEVSDLFTRYIGVDVIRYDGFPIDAEFEKVNLDSGRAALPDGCAEIVASVETIEHLENPRAFIRELARLAKPNGYVIVTTPNQLSLLSLLTLIVKKQFQAFQNTSYPAHITALLEIDLRRIAEECGLCETVFAYSHKGRIMFTPYSFPESLARLMPRLLSDNLLMIARKPA